MEGSKYRVSGQNISLMCEVCDMDCGGKLGK